MAAVAAMPASYGGPAPSPVPAGWRPGTLPPGSVVRVGEHRVIVERFLSEGGFAHVYLVRSEKPIPAGTDAVLHVLKRIAVPDKEALQAVRKEVDIMKALRGNRHIIHFIEATASELPKKAGYEVYILMEYAQGGGIIDMMNTRLQNRLTESEILKIFSDTVEAVAHMHQQDPPLIHRDLKVENILLSSPSLYKLCDFGSTTVAMSAPPQSVAEIQALEADLNKNTTLQYRAPEMCDVWSRKPIGLPADVWALGVFLYKLCFYTTPFEEHGMLAIQNAQYKMPAYPAYSPAIRELIASMLQENAARRPPIEAIHQRVCAMRGVKPKYLAKPVKSLSSKSEASHSTSGALESIVQTSGGTAPTPPLASNGPSIAPMRRGRPGDGVRLARTGVARSSEAWDAAPTKTSASISSLGFGDTFTPSATATTALSPPATSSSPWPTSSPAPIPANPIALSALTKSPEPSLPRPLSGQGSFTLSASFGDAFDPSETAAAGSTSASPRNTPQPTHSLPPMPGPKAASTSTLALNGTSAAHRPARTPAAEAERQDSGPPLPTRPKPSSLGNPRAATTSLTEGERPQLVSRGSQTSPRLVTDWLQSGGGPSAVPGLSSSSATPTIAPKPKPSSLSRPIVRAPPFEVDLLGGDAVDSPTTTTRRDLSGALATLRDNEQETEVVNEAISSARPLPSIPAPVGNHSARISMPVGEFDYETARRRYQPVESIVTSSALQSPPLPTKPERLRRPSKRSVDSSDDEEASEPVSLPTVSRTDTVDDQEPETPVSPVQLPSLSPSMRLSPQPMSITSSSSTFSKDSLANDDAVDPAKGNFDLERALSSIRKFAPTSSTTPPSHSQTPTPSAAPPLQAPKPRAAISNLVSRYETLSAASPPLEGGPRPGSGSGSAASRSRRTSSVTGASPRSPSFTARFPSIDLTGSDLMATPPASTATRKPFRPTPPKVAERRGDTGPGEEEDRPFEGVNAMKARWETRGGGATANGGGSGGLARAKTAHASTGRRMEGREV